MAEREGGTKQHIGKTIDGVARTAKCKKAHTSGLLSCRIPAGDYTTYEGLDAGIEFVTGIKNGLFLLPLNVRAADESLFSKYPYLRVLDDYSDRFREAADAPKPDRGLYRELMAGLGHDLSDALPLAD